MFYFATGFRCYFCYHALPGDSAPRTSKITPLYNEKIKDFTKTYQKVTQILVSANSLILNLLIRGHVLWVRWS